MGKSKSGGTRSLLRGKVGADVYSIGKDGKGKRQQVVRSLAEQVANPQTLNQMRGRMIMSTVMQAVSALKQIIDHSFDGIAKGQPSISEFIRVNYGLVKADVAANPASGNKFGLVKYKEKGARGGEYLISDGAAIWPSVFSFESGNMTITAGAGVTTAGGVRSALGVAVGDYMTLVVIEQGGSGHYARLIVSDNLADDVVLSNSNIALLFEVEGDLPLQIIWSETSGKVDIMQSSTMSIGSIGWILSQKDDSAWIHSKCVMDYIDSSYTADVALPTYPVGTEQFLNGGDL